MPYDLKNEYLTLLEISGRLMQKTHLLCAEVPQGSTIETKLSTDSFIAGNCCRRLAANFCGTRLDHGANL